MASEEGSGPPCYGMPLATDLYQVEGETTFQYQDTLPSLPVPDLRETLNKYLDSVRPHVTPEELQRTEMIVNAFANGVGKTLQDKLQQKARGMRNWLADWWEQYAYLLQREPTSLVNFLAPAPCHMFMWPPEDGTQCERAALTTWYTLQFWQMLRKEKMRVDRGFGGTLWCMNQYRRIFNGCKTPDVEIDKLNCYFRTEREGAAPSHLVVACKGRHFTFNVLDSNGDIITAPEIEAQLQYVRQLCDKEPWGSGLGVLTGEHRVTWHQLRQHLISLHSDNKHNLETIETSLFLVVLDDNSAVGYSEISTEGLLGEGRNRWYDKALSMIYLKNGLSTFNCDHACQDGVINISHTFWTLVGLQRCGGTWQGPTNVRPLQPPQELAWRLDDVIRKGVETAITSLQAREKNVDILNRFFRHFGKTYLRQHKLHPDAFMQVVVQCAYHRLHGKPASTYETATTRKFYMGRTGTIRSCTMEALAFSKAMVNKAVSKKECMELMNIAMQKQISMNNECADGKGCDRHLLGLQIVALQEGIPMPELYTDPAYTKSGGGGNYTLSTSFVGYTPVFGGTSAMCKDGYGCFYGIPPDWINLFITCWRSDQNTGTQQLYDAIEQTLLEARDLLEECGQGAKL